MYPYFLRRYTKFGVICEKQVEWRNLPPPVRVFKNGPPCIYKIELTRMKQGAIFHHLKGSGLQTRASGSRLNIKQYWSQYSCFCSSQLISTQDWYLLFH